MQNNSVKSILFDLDGTLVHSAADILAAINYTLNHYSFAAIGYNDCLDYLGDGINELIRRSIGNSSDKPIDAQYFADIVAYYKEYYTAHLADRTHLYPGVRVTLAELQTFELAVISNKTYKFCIAILEKLHVAGYFRFIIGGDSLPTQKPDPGQIVYIMQKLNLKATEIIIVGDSENDIQAAHAIGAPVVAVTYGYRDEKILRRHQPEYMIDSFPELLKIIT